MAVYWVNWLVGWLVGLGTFRVCSGGFVLGVWILCGFVGWFELGEFCFVCMILGGLFGCLVGLREFALVWGSFGAGVRSSLVRSLLME